MELSVKYVNDLLDENGGILSIDTFSQIYNFRSTALTYMYLEYKE